MIPKFLSPFAAELEKHKLDTIKITATPLKEGESLHLTQSKFLGIPYLPSGIEYPRGKEGKPMVMLAQINFAEAPFLEDYPTKGILQWFVSGDGFDTDDFKVLFHEDISSDFQLDFSFLTKAVFEESPIFCEHSITFEKKTEYGGTQDFRFEMSFNGKSYYDFQDTLPKEQQTEFDQLLSATGHKIGGYAFFTQSDPRGDDMSLEDLLLLQIDTDEQIMWGDSGVAHLFLNAADLKNRNFEKAYFYWDCC